MKDEQNTQMYKCMNNGSMQIGAHSLKFTSNL